MTRESAEPKTRLIKPRIRETQHAKEGDPHAGEQCRELPGSGHKGDLVQFTEEKVQTNAGAQRVTETMFPRTK